jgi:hypothetical protein
MLMRRIIFVIMILLQVSCSARHSPFFWGYGEWIPGDVATVDRSSTANFDWSTLPNVITRIDGTPIGQGYKKARLLPGKHRFEFEDHPAQFGGHPKGQVKIDLLPGHEYDFRIDYCFWCIPRRYSVWVDDKTTGELLWGKRPDWPSWWL